MAKIIESIPNISEGRNLAIVEQIVDQVRNTPGCILMDYSSDENHNRSVITYMGSPDAVEEASVKIAVKAAQLINLNDHKGEHPRMGAVDVMPFVPLVDTDMEECIELSKRVGEKVAKEAKIPVFLYEKSATKENCKNLANIRKGGFEGMQLKIDSGEFTPDFGGKKINKNAGVVAIGARKPLIAYNVQLDTSNVEIAKKISSVIRESNGGLPCVKAIGIMLESKNIAQVSMNLTDYTVTPPHVAVEKIKEEAAKLGVKVIGTELIGLMPMRALIKAGAYYLKIDDFDEKTKVIEEYLL